MICLDFETFYAPGYGLRTLTTEEYIRHPWFQVIGFAYKIGAAPAVWVTGTDEYMAQVLAGLPWESSALCAHNCRFDAAILNWRFGLRPRKYIDTMSLARGLVGLATSCSLEKLGQYFNLPIQKGHEVVKALGLRRDDFPPDQLLEYGEYCKNDTEMSYLLAELLIPRTLPGELQLQDWTIRAFAEPKLVLDENVLREELAAFQQRRAGAMARCGISDISVLRSDDAMANALLRRGIDPPVKLSPKQKNPDGSPKMVWAFSKEDVEFMDLLDHEDEDVVALVEARIGAKSSIVETRLQRLIGVSRRGAMPMPMMYAGATPTRRWTGDDNINVQNLPRNKLKKDADGNVVLDADGNPVIDYSPLRRAICAPPGFRMAAADLSQIELRVNAWQSGQHDVLDILRNGGDVYSDQATALYGYTITKKSGKTVHQVERFVGKTTELQCLAGDTLVLTPRGAVPIVSVSQDDLLWDGVEWVSHDGLVPRGQRATLQAGGLWATGDHKVRGLSGWRPWARRTASTLSLLSARATAIWSLRAMLYQAALSGQWPAAAAVVPVAGPQKATSVQAGRRGATSAPSSQQPGGSGLRATSWWGKWSGRIACTAKWMVGSLVSAWLAGPGRSSAAATSWADSQLPRPDASTAAASTSASPLSAGTSEKSGGTCATASQAPRPGWLARMRASVSFLRGWTSTVSSPMPSSSRAGAGWFVVSSSTALMVAAIMDLRTAGGSTPRRVQETFDLANAGPRNRFTVVADGLPLLVHNCGYQCGWEKFLHSLKVAAKRDGMTLPDTSPEFGRRIVDGYRQKRAKIKAFWYAANEALQAMAYGMRHQLGPYEIHDYRLWLPNGSYLYYPNLRLVEKKGPTEIGTEWVYDRYRKGRMETTKMYGGKFVENITQAHARLFVSDALLRLETLKWPDGNRVFESVFMVHDELVVLFPEHLSDDYVKQCLTWAMTTPATWAPDLPLDCEIGIANNYAEAK